MASSQARHRTSAPDAPRYLLPIAVVVLVYVVVGALWILGSGPIADALTEATPIPRWVVELAKALAFVTITALVLQVVLRRRDDRLDAVATTTHEDDELAAIQDRNRLQASGLSGTANAVMITDRDGTIEWVNAAFETMSGYASSVAVGATPRLVKSGLQDEAFYRDLWETILAGRVWRGQVVNQHNDGELYTVSQTITPVIAECGEIQNFVAIHEDITERLRAMRELEASSMRLESLFDHALDAIMLADDEGRYTAVNPAVCELTGYSRDELLSMGPADLATPDQQPADVTDRFAQFVRAGAESGTFTLRHKGGHVVETEYRAVANVQPGVHLSLLRDVTARNTMLRALTVAEEEFRELAENATDIVAKLRVDTDGRTQVDYVNPAAATILGHPREDLTSDPELFLRLFHQRGEDLDDGPDLLPTPAEPTKLATVQVQRRDGDQVWLEVHSTLTDPATAPITIQLVARDVTARSEMMAALEQALQDQLEAAEQLRTLNSMKDTFLQSVSHELRTPLTSILGFAQLLADPRHGLSPGDAREVHHRILNNAQRLQRLLDDLLDVDRFTRGHVEPNRQATDLADLIRRMVHASDLAQHRIDLDLEPITMDIEGPAVERIIANLLHNIARHTPPDTRAWIRARATAAGVELTVDDDGPGIPAGDRQRVIEPFHQGPGSASFARPGTGVGLSLANTFARRHGGGLAIDGSPAGGTRITVSLAHARVDTPDAALH